MNKSLTPLLNHELTVINIIFFPTSFLVVTFEPDDCHTNRLKKTPTLNMTWKTIITGLRYLKNPQHIINPNFVVV